MRTTPEDKKQQVIAGLVDARSKILASVAALPPAQQDVVFLGEWSVKDLLAHLIGWDFANLEATKEALAGKLPSFYATTTTIGEPTTPAWSRSTRGKISLHSWRQ